MEKNQGPLGSDEDVRQIAADCASLIKKPKSFIRQIAADANLLPDPLGGMSPLNSLKKKVLLAAQFVFTWDEEGKARCDRMLAELESPSGDDPMDWEYTHNSNSAPKVASPAKDRMKAKPSKPEKDRKEDKEERKEERKDPETRDGDGGGRKRKR